MAVFIGYLYNYLHEANLETYQPRLLDCRKGEIIIDILRCREMELHNLNYSLQLESQ